MPPAGDYIRAASDTLALTSFMCVCFNKQINNNIDDIV
jgi:hypothetical protein